MVRPPAQRWWVAKQVEAKDEPQSASTYRTKQAQHAGRRGRGGTVGKGGARGRPKVAASGGAEAQVVALQQYLQ